MSVKKPPRNGKHTSTSVGLPSPKKNIWPDPSLKKFLARVYNLYQKLDDPDLNRRCRQDFVFHMTDWLNDLRGLGAVYNDPDSTDKKEAAQAVFCFLIHAVPHLMAAGHLLLGKEMTHPFDIPSEKPA